MRRYRVVLSTRADAHLDAIWNWIASQASSETADFFTEKLLERCRSLEHFPQRGTPRDDIRPELRTIPFRRRVTIGFVVAGEDVVITGLAYRGQDLTALIGEEPSDLV